MSEEIDRWVKYMRENPDKWKKTHTEFINAQIIKSREFIKRLSKQSGGKQKIIDAYKIKNIGGYTEILS